MSSHSSVLDKLNRAVGKRQNDGNARVDYKALAEIKKKSIYKFKKGKNEIVFVNSELTEDEDNPKDPFLLWSIHQGLQETSYWSVNCDKGNKDENCPICNLIEDLKSDNYKANEHIFKPILQKFETWVTIVDVSSEATISEGIKWVRLSKSIVTQLNEWITNLEEGEEEFYNDGAPQKIIVNYNPSETPANQYKLDKKNYKAFSEERLEKWRAELKPFAEFNPSKSENEIKKMLDEYLIRIEKDASEKEEESNEDEDEDDEEQEEPKTSKQTSLNKLKSLSKNG